MHDGLLTVVLAGGSGDHYVAFEGVLDKTMMGEVIGLEILGVKQQLEGGHALPGPVVGFPRWSYDDEIDALYVRIADGSAHMQKMVSGTALLDGFGSILSLEVRTAPG